MCDPLGKNLLLPSWYAEDFEEESFASLWGMPRTLRKNLLHSLHLPHLFTFLRTPLLFLYKNLPLLSFPHTIWFSILSETPSFSHFLSRLSLSPQMAPKAKKTSYVLSSDVFLLTHWSGAVRLMEPPTLTYWPGNHIPMVESVSFSNFSHFQVYLWSPILMCFWPCKCLDFVVGWV